MNRLLAIGPVHVSTGHGLARSLSLQLRDRLINGNYTRVHVLVRRSPHHQRSVPVDARTEVTAVRLNRITLDRVNLDGMGLHEYSVQLGLTTAMATTSGTASCMRARRAVRPSSTFDVVTTRTHTHTHTRTRTHTPCSSYACASRCTPLLSTSACTVAAAHTRVHFSTAVPSATANATSEAADAPASSRDAVPSHLTHPPDTHTSHTTPHPHRTPPHTSPSPTSPTSHTHDADSAAVLSHPHHCSSRHPHPSRSDLEIGTGGGRPLDGGESLRQREAEIARINAQITELYRAGDYVQALVRCCKLYFVPRTHAHTHGHTHTSPPGSSWVCSML